MILITGATGRIGRHLVSFLLKKKEKKIMALVKNEQSLELLPKGAEPVYGDITDAKSLESIKSGIEVVFHLAALVDYEAPEEELYKVNVQGTENLLKVCIKKGVKRFVYCSSIGVHGKKLKNTPTDETEPYDPTDRYNASKYLAEKIVISYMDRIPLVIIRPALVYGKGFEKGYFSIFRLLEKNILPIIGSGENYIPLVHVSDVVEGLWLASKVKKAVGNTYILASDGCKTQKEIFEMVCRYLGAKPPSFSIPVWVAKIGIRAIRIFKKLDLTLEYVDVIASNRAFNISKAMGELGYKPKVRLEKGIKEMVEDYKKCNSSNQLSHEKS